MTWSELTGWQDFQVDLARKDILEKGRVIPKVVFLAPGNVREELAESGLSVVSGPESKGDGPLNSCVVVIRDTSPIGIASLFQASARHPAGMNLMWMLGERQGWTREKTAEEICRIMRKEWGAQEDMDLHWAGLKSLGAKLKAYACVNITEAYVCGEDERAKGQQVRDVPNRREAVLLNLEDGRQARQVTFEIKREVPSDESSKVIGIGDNVVMTGMIGRATGLIKQVVN